MNTTPAAETDATARGIPPFSDEDYTRLRRHVISMKNGLLGQDPPRFPANPDDFLTSRADIDALLGDLNIYIEGRRRENKPARIMLHAHGGLVSAASGLDYARTVIPWWLDNGVYPIYFVWRSGFWSTLGALIEQRWSLSREFYPDEFFDPTLELLLRNVWGPEMWTEMKADAAAASAGDDHAAVLFASGLGSILSPLEKGAVTVHAVGHSAGSVFLGHFLAPAKQNGITTFDSVSLLAPAMRVDLFKETFVEAMKAGSVKNLSMYTMTKKAEHGDSCFVAYRKSLLYLVSGAFEPARGAAILGLQEAVHSDAELTRLFGADGRHAPASVVWSPTRDGDPRASKAKSHGDFDNDAATMQSVAEDIIGSKPTAFPSAKIRGLAAQPPVRPAAGRGAARPTRKALCIGIDDYPNAPLTGCVADANSWAAALRALGFDQVTVLTNEQATTRGILSHLTELVANAREGDVVAVQYSGHGTEMPDLDFDEQIGTAPSPKDQALIPHGAALGEVILDDDLAAIWEIIRPGVNVTAFFDSCHSGNGTRGEVANTGVGTTATIEHSDNPRVNVRWVASLADAQAAFRRLRGSPPRVTELPPVRAILFSACKPYEVAYESGGQGVFTRAAMPLLASPLLLTNAQFAERVGATIVPPPSTVQTPGLWEYEGGFPNDQLLLSPLAAASPATPPASGSALVPMPAGGPDGREPTLENGPPESRADAIANFLRATANLLQAE